MRRGVVLLCLTVLAVSSTTAQGKTTPEPVLARCKRPEGGLCMQFCEHGHKTDELGCALCECLDNPCEDETICASEGQGYVCEPKATCNTDPCTSMEHQCKSIIPCPMPMCEQSCEYGYKNDSRGCMSCECKENSCDGHKCAKGHTCIVSAPHLPFFHNTLDKFCLPDLHKPDFLNHYPTHPMNMDLDEFPPLCTFRELFFAEMKKQIYEQIPNPPRHLRDSLELQVNCNEDGTFHPVQCNYQLQACWCVNDVGLEIKGSRVKLGDSQEEPDCEQYQTIKVEITMVITHSFDNLDEHMDGIKETLVDQLSAWLEIDGQYIEIDAILPHNDAANLIKVDLTITHDGVTDLAFVAERFKFDTKKTPHVVECHGKDMTIDGQSVQVKHTSKPLSEIDEDDSDEDMDDDDDSYSSRCSRLWHEHKGVFFVAGFGILVVLLVILGCGIAACRRKQRANVQFKHSKMDNYKENLAYQNQVFGHPDLAENKEKDVKVLGTEYGKDGKPTPKY